MTTTYTDKIHDIALNTFEVTCYMFPLDEWEMDEEEVVHPDKNSTRSIVQFDGAAEGAMVINPNEELLQAIAANMLGVDEANEEEKEGALCEIANIICGNTVPLFSRNEKICYIRPPRIAEESENADELFNHHVKEDVKVFLDEGVVDISIYYTEE